MTSFHSYTFTLELQSVIEFNIVKKINKKKSKTHFLKKHRTMEVHESGSEIIFSEEKKKESLLRQIAS